MQFTTGQAFVMAFQAGGAHALDRALEALAYAYVEMTRTPATAAWSKPAGKGDPLTMTKTFHVVPRGVALVIGCNTFPTWNSYPGLFASLATGNAVVVKPHPRAVLPLAITVRIAREVLADAGFDPNLVTLAAEEPGEGLAKTLATRPEVRIIDFTGSTEYGDWLERNAEQAVGLHREGRRQHHHRRLHRRLRRHVPQHRLLSDSLQWTDVHHAAEHPGARRSASRPTRGTRASTTWPTGIAGAVGGADRRPGPGVELTGAIVNDGVLERLDRARRTAASRARLDHRDPSGPRGRHRPYPTDRARPRRRTSRRSRAEWFGPISFVVATESTEDSLELFRRTVGAKGALTASVYSTDEPVLDAARDAALDGRGAPVLQPDRRRVREPVRGILGFPRKRGESGRERLADRRCVSWRTGSGLSSRGAIREASSPVSGPRPPCHQIETDRGLDCPIWAAAVREQLV